MKHKVFIIGTGLMISAFFLSFVGALQYITNDEFYFTNFFQLKSQETYIILFKLSIMIALISGVLVTYDLLIDAYHDIKGFVLKKFRNR